MQWNKYIFEKNNQQFIWCWISTVAHVALPERLESVRDTTKLLYQKTKEKLGYRQTLKDAMEITEAATQGCS